MRNNRNYWSPLVMIAGVLYSQGVSAQSPDHRFEARLSDGSRITENSLTNWHTENAQAQLAGRKVFDAGNPFRWLIDRNQPLPSTPEAYLEFVGGDRLPCRIVEFRDSDNSAIEQLPPHLVVSPAFEFNLPGSRAHAHLRVTTKWLRRAVWQHGRPRAYQPGTLFLRDDRRFQFESLRWNRQEISLLRDGNVQSFSIGELAEVHFPSVEQWDSYFGQLAILSPTSTARLIQFESSDGMKVTTSTERLLPRFTGDKNKSENWYPLVQPAWSLDAFSVPIKNVRSWRFFSPDQIPLTWFHPANETQESTFGDGWRRQVDRNVQGEFLKSGQQEFAWGFGVHARNELEFNLHPAVIRFRAQFGLDATVGNGGSVKVAVGFANPKSAPLFESAVLVGSAQTFDTGGIPIKSNNGRRLTLLVDSLAQSHPANADPFDIRDHLDWLEPTLSLDATQLKEAVSARWAELLWAMEGWELDGNLQVATVWDELAKDDARWLTVISPTDNFLTYSKELTVGKRHSWLAIAVGSFPEKGKTPARIQVWLNGTAAADFEVPLQTSATPLKTLLVPIDNFRGKKVRVELVHMSPKNSLSIDWRGATLLDDEPGLLRIFDKEDGFAAEFRGQEDKAQLVDEDAPYGKALRVIPPGVGAASLAVLAKRIANIREHPQWGEFRHLRFAWKAGGEGAGALNLELAHHGRFGVNEAAPPQNALANVMLSSRTGRLRIPFGDTRGLQYGYRYVAGPDAKQFGPAHHLSGSAPKEWQVVTRDLFGDFGDFRLTGLGLHLDSCDYALLDQIYLARTADDLKVLEQRLKQKTDEPPKKVDPNVILMEQLANRYVNVISRVAPQFSSSAVGGDGVALLNEHGGRKNVLKTHPPAKGTPCILRSTLKVSAAGKTILRMSVSHEPMGDWHLLVLANGEKLHDSIVSETSVKEGWQEVRVDLSKLRGQRVLLEVHNHPNNWTGETAYWHGMKIDHPAN